jgi:hypothetical protein
MKVDLSRVAKAELRQYSRYVRIAEHDVRPAIREQIRVISPPPALTREEGASWIIGGAVVPSPRASSRPFADESEPSELDVPAAIGIPMHLVPAMGTVVNADTEVLGDHGVTLAALLRGTAWVHTNQLTHGTFNLSGKDSCELSPRSVQTLPREHAAPKGFEIEIFDRDSVVLLDDCSRGLVVKVSPLVRDLGVCSAFETACFGAVLPAEFTASCAALGRCKLALCGLQRAWVRDEVPVGKRCESLDTDVDARLSPGGRQRLGGDVVADQVSVPMPVGVELDADLLNTSLDRAMELNFDLADPRKLQPLVAGHQLGTVAVGSIGESEALVPVSSLEPRVARLGRLLSLGPGFLGFLAASEEVLEGSLKPTKGVLEQVEVHACELGTNGFDLAELCGLRFVPWRLPGLVVGVPALLQCGVVQLAKQGEYPEKRALLRRRRVQSIAERSLHQESILGSGQRATSPPEFQRSLSNRLPLGSDDQVPTQSVDRPNDRPCAGDSGKPGVGMGRSACRVFWRSRPLTRVARPSTQGASERRGEQFENGVVAPSSERVPDPTGSVPWQRGPMVSIVLPDLGRGRPDRGLEAIHRGSREAGLKRPQTPACRCHSEAGVCLSSINNALAAFAQAPVDGVEATIRGWPRPLRLHYIHPFKVFYERRPDALYVIRLRHYARRPIEQQ